MKRRQGFGVRLCGLGLTVAVLLATSRASGGDYIYRTIDVPGDAGGTYGVGVNSVGLVTGYYIDAGGASHGFTWQDGTTTTVDYTGVPGVTETYLFQDNSSGQVAGYYTASDGTSHSFIYNSAGGTFTTIPDAPGGYPFNAAGGINDSGQLAGNYSTDPTAATNLVGWLYDIKSNTYTTFTAPQSDQALYGTATYGMNNKGDIAGYYVDSGGNYDGYVWDPKTGFRPVLVPGATGGTFPLGINDADTVVGNAIIGNTSYGFLLDSSNNLTTIMIPGAVSTVIGGIDDRGDITGFYEDAAGNIHAFYGQAVPEPAALALMAGGLIVMAFWTRRRSRVES